MKLTLPNKLTRLDAHWEMLAITAVLFVLVAVFVDLKPVVGENFFFSTSDPGFGQSKKIEQRFPSQREVILAVSAGDISSPRYLGRLVWPDHGRHVPVKPGVLGNARYLHERSFVDPARAANVRQKNRDPHRQPRHHRVHRGVIAPGLHDVQLANAGRPDASFGE